jgi:hypothetical protein
VGAAPDPLTRTPHEAGGCKKGASMTWVTFRQHRWPLLLGGLLLAAFAAILPATGGAIHEGARRWPNGSPATLVSARPPQIASSTPLRSRTSAGCAA